MLRHINRKISTPLRSSNYLGSLLTIWLRLPAIDSLPQYQAMRLHHFQALQVDIDRWSAASTAAVTPHKTWQCAHNGSLRCCSGRNRDYKVSAALLIESLAFRLCRPDTWSKLSLLLACQLFSVYIRCWVRADA